jgi:hypothetical protein
MKIQNEEQILNRDFRSNVIKEIIGSENTQRKRNAEDRYLIYKDQTKDFVLDRFKKEQGLESAKEVEHRISNISFCKKMVNKKAQVYDHGVERIVIGDEPDELKEVKQDQINKQASIVGLDACMQKVNNFSELQKNATIKIMPYVNPATGKWRYKPFPLNPYFYDVIEDGNNPELPLVHIFSYFHDSAESNQSSLTQGIRSNDDVNFRFGDGVDQTIADSPKDDYIDKIRYIWWSHNYHFTTNGKGDIIPDASPDDLRNPIGTSCFVDFSIDQDSHYWAIGGDDIVDAAILINMLLTDLYYISRYQGLGIFYFFGRGVPKQIKIGPKEVLTLDIREGDPTPQIGFANSNAPLDQHMKMIEQHLAFILSTNNIMATAIQGSLTAATAQSGIQEIVQRSENVGDIEASQQLYKDGEPRIFQKMAKWHNLYLSKGLLDDDLAELGPLDENIQLMIKFGKPQVTLSDKEKLEIYKLREELGIDSEIDLIMKDNPMLTREEAENRFKQILEDKLIKSSMQLVRMVENGQESNLQIEDTDAERPEEESGEVEERDR